jgi:hypothetical protein
MKKLNTCTVIKLRLSTFFFKKGREGVGAEIIEKGNIGSRKQVRQRRCYCL